MRECLVPTKKVQVHHRHHSQKGLTHFRFLHFLVIYWNRREYSFAIILGTEYPL